MHPLFLEYMQQRWPDTVPALASSPVTSIRLNPAKQPAPEALQRECAAAWLEGAEAVPWHPAGRYLAERPNFTLDPALHQGMYYVQDASSMLVGTIARRLADRLGHASPLLYLDACAAPGGKTTAAIAALPPDAVVFANEYDYRRANILAENVAKWGSPRTVVTRGDTARYAKLRDTFDIVAVDAPCSGEGMMRKDETAREQWTPALVRECAARQDEILLNLWPAVKPGGYLVYSTCTFNEDENEGVIARLTEAIADEEPTARPSRVDIGELLEGIELPGVTRDGDFLRFLPGRARGEGLCVTVLRKGCEEALNGAGGVCARSTRKTKQRDARSKGKNARPAAAPALLKALLPEGYVTETDGDGRITAMPADMADRVGALLPKLDVVCAGVEVGTVKGKDLIPSQQLALSRALRTDAVPTFPLTLDQALTYLRRDTLTLADDCPRGIVLLTYNDRPLGWVKHLGNRTNNLYPAEWRIRH